MEEINYSEILGFERWVRIKIYDPNLCGWSIFEDFPETCKLALLQEYLREKHRLHINIEWDLEYPESDKMGIYEVNVLGLEVDAYLGVFKSYPEALKAGIKEAIKLIKE